MNPINSAAPPKAVEEALKEYNAYDSDWGKAYFDKYNSGGFVVAHKQRVEHSKVSKNEKVKYGKELRMSTVFAKSGKEIVFLTEPHFWYNVTPNLALGSEIEISNNFLTKNKDKAYINPTIAAKWNF
ncbi:MAG: DUF5020 family protein [Prevotellaceae bacterium]|jgi:hypothetical protein|nr:DUF5020 family protein [Prevotellaceae bacterium]